MISEPLQHRRREAGRARTLVGRRELDCALRRAQVVEAPHEIGVGTHADSLERDAEPLRKFEVALVEAEQEQESRRLDADRLDGHGVLELRHTQRDTLDAQLAAQRRDDGVVLDVDERSRLRENGVEVLRGFVLNVELGAEVAADANDGRGHDEVAHRSSLERLDAAEV